MNCPNCGVPLMGGMVICPKCKFDTRTKDGGESFRQHTVKMQEEKAKEEEKAIKEKNREIYRREMIMTTCPSVEGYRITKQCGLVFGEVAFKIGALKSMAASFENWVEKSFSIGDTELSGTAWILSDAKKYAMNKMIDRAVERDANAIVGISVESSFGGEDILHVSMSGTAVNIEKTDG